MAQGNKNWIILFSLENVPMRIRKEYFGWTSNVHRKWSLSKNQFLKWTVIVNYFWCYMVDGGLYKVVDISLIYVDSLQRDTSDILKETDIQDTCRSKFILRIITVRYINIEMFGPEFSEWYLYQKFFDHYGQMFCR